MIFSGPKKKPPWPKKNLRGRLLVGALFVSENIVRLNFGPILPILPHRGCSILPDPLCLQGRWPRM